MGQKKSKAGRYETPKPHGAEYYDNNRQQHSHAILHQNQVAPQQNTSNSPISHVRQQYQLSIGNYTAGHVNSHNCNMPPGVSHQINSQVANNGIAYNGNGVVLASSYPAHRGISTSHVPQQVPLMQSNNAANNSPYLVQNARRQQKMQQNNSNLSRHHSLSVDTSVGRNSDLDDLLQEFNQDEQVANETALLLFGMLEHWRTPAAGAMLMHSAKSLCAPGSNRALGIVRDKKNGNTLLIASAFHGNIELCRLLLHQGKTVVNVNLQNYAGDTALHMACGGGGQCQKSFLLVEVLVENGARSDIQNSEGKTALHFAGQDGDADLIALLLLHGGNTDLRDRFGCTPFDYASRRGHLNATNLLTPKNSSHFNNKRFQFQRESSNNSNYSYSESHLSSQHYNKTAMHRQNKSHLPHKKRTKEWEQVWDPANNCYYYYNRQTGMSSWEPPPDMNVVSPAHYTSPMGGSLYTRTWREGDTSEYGTHVFENREENRAQMKQDFEKKVESSLDDSHDYDGWGPPVSPKNHSRQNFFSPKHSATSPNYKQKTEQTSPSKNKHNDDARLEIEKLRHELEIKSQEMSKMKEETKLANAMVEAAKAEADLAIAKANNKASTLEDQKEAMQKEMALKVAELMQEQTMVQEEMRKKIQESAQAASDAALAANNKIVSEEEKERQAKIEEELQRRNEELSEVRRMLDEAEQKRKKAEEDTVVAKKQGEDMVETRMAELKRQAILDLEKKEKEMQRRVEEQDEKLRKELVQQAKKAEDARQAEVDALDRVEKLMSDLKGREEKIGSIQKQLKEMETKDELAQKELQAKAELERRQKILENEAKLMENKMRHFSIENEQLREDFFAEQKERRKYLEELEHMKGTIRVLCRVRPCRSDDECAVIFPDPQTVRMKQVSESVMGVSRTIRKSFEFDCVFQPGCTQAQVFEQAKPMVQNAVDGFNVCLFAYGQTGSGKTFTMMGPEGSWGSEMKKKQEIDVDVDNSLYGVAPRAVIELFEIQKRLKGKIDVKIRYSMLELYRDHLEDLLLGNNVRTKLTIKKDPRGIVYVQNLTTEEVLCPEDVERLMRRGHKQRHTAATLMNSESSRSHLLMTFNIDCVNLNTKISTVGKLTLVDLAGSERVGKSGTSGVSQAEGTAINKSLTALGDVIAALTTGSKHIPYRNHPLTMLMSDSLGGNAKTLMFVNISPLSSNIDESLSSLQYASRVKKVSNKSTKQIETKEIRRLKKQLAKLNK